MAAAAGITRAGRSRRTQTYAPTSSAPLSNPTTAHDNRSPGDVPGASKAPTHTRATPAVTFRRVQCPVSVFADVTTRSAASDKKRYSCTGPIAAASHGTGADAGP